jgi:surfeit locus 1 family protein
MRIGPLSFAPGWLTTIAAAAMLALLLSLGRWQLNRAAEKEQRQALLDARIADAPLRLTGSVPSAEPLLFRRVTAAGEWLPERQVFVDNQILDGRAGFAVITPLRLAAASEAVLVNRGWIARDATYPRAPAAPVPAGRAEVSGLAVLPPARYLELSPQGVTGNVWQNLSIERFRAHTGLDVLPIVILQDRPGAGLKARRERPDAGVAKHYEYAGTWFALAATVLALWVGLNLRRQR